MAPRKFKKKSGKSDKKCCPSPKDNGIKYCRNAVLADEHNSGPIHLNGIFNFEEFDKQENTYLAAETTISEVRQMDQINAIIDSSAKIEYFVNHEKKSALLLKSVARVSARRFVRKYSRRSKNINDVGNRKIPTLTGYRAVNFFYKKQQFQDFVLAVPCGNANHETAMFFRKYDSKLDVIFFNPNYSDIQDGVQRNNVASKFLCEFGRTIRSIRAYHAPNGNEDSQCSVWTWQEIYNHICHGISPFTKDTLQEYSQNMTENTYKRYHKPKMNANEHNDVWGRGKTVLKNATDKQILEISKRISRIFLEYL